MNSSKKFRRFLAILTILTVVFIWGNSILPAGLSALFSSEVAEILGSEDEGLIRKLAHFSEFLLLGGELSLLFSLYKKSGKEKCYLFFTFAMFFPLMDETIQIFNDRGPMVQDIWIDIAGYTTGCLLALVLWKAGMRFRSKEKVK